MRDDWEKKHGLNPQDRTDAEKDKDGDGFTNKEEFDAGTDPTDPKSRPELTYKLRVEKIDVKSFMLRFRSTIMGPDGFRVYGLNRIQAGGVFTYFKKIGQDVSGFKLVKFEEKFQMKTSAGSKIPQRVDASELTLVQGDKVVVLEKGKDEEQFEYTAHLIFLVNKKKFSGTQNDGFVLQDERYKILRIDRDSETVVIEREQDGKQFTIPKLK